MRALILIAAILLGVAGSCQAQRSFGQKPRYPAGDGPSFDQRLHGGTSLADPRPVIVVLLLNGRYLEFAPADVLTLRQLVDKLPPDALTKTSRLLLLRKNEGVMFSAKGLQTEDLSAYSLARWDLVKIEEPGGNN